MMQHSTRLTSCWRSSSSSSLECMRSSLLSSWPASFKDSSSRREQSIFSLPLRLACFDSIGTLAAWSSWVTSGQTHIWEPLLPADLSKPVDQIDAPDPAEEAQRAQAINFIKRSLQKLASSPTMLTINCHHAGEWPISHARPPPPPPPAPPSRGPCSPRSWQVCTNLFIRYWTGIGHMRFTVKTSLPIPRHPFLWQSAMSLFQCDIAHAPAMKLVL